jgi:hypothetical protein
MSRTHYSTLLYSFDTLRRSIREMILPMIGSLVKRDPAERERDLGSVGFVFRSKPGE